MDKIKELPVGIQATILSFLMGDPVMMRIKGMTRFRKAASRFKKLVQWYGRLGTLPLYEYHKCTKLSTIIEWEKNRFILKYGGDDDDDTD